MVGLVLRFWPEYVELQRRVAAGELGRPLAASAYRLSPPADWADWYADRSQSGGPPVDLMVHDFDQMNWLFGTPRTVYARAVCSDPPTPTTCVAVVGYDGAEAVVEGSMAMPASFPFSSSIRLLCEGGVAEYALPAPLRPRAGGTSARPTRARAGCACSRATASPRSCLLDPVDPWGPEIEEFVSCVEQGRQPSTAPASRRGSASRLARRQPLAPERPAGGGLMVDARDRVLARVEALRDGRRRAAPGARPRRLDDADVRPASTRGRDRRRDPRNEILRERYEQAGLETHWVADDPERRNLVGVRSRRAAGAR